jgi:hypothetical protein
VRMISPSLTDTQVELTRGEALVEVAQVAPENRLVVVTQGVPIEMAKYGLYRFNAEPARVAVYDGKASVTQGDRTFEVGKGKQRLVANANPKTQNFDRNQTGELYNWSMLRSEYEAEANQSAVRTILVGSLDGMGLAGIGIPGSARGHSSPARVTGEARSGSAFTRLYTGVLMGRISIGIALSAEVSRVRLCVQRRCR